jgi:hypothetical protein
MRPQLPILALLALLVPATVFAQAWGGPKGYAAVILQYIYTNGGDHLFSEDLNGASTRGYVSDGKRWYLGETTTNTVYLLLEYGLLDQISLAGSIAWVASKYEGRAPYDRERDDGSYHPTWQDGGFEVRWHFLDKPLAMTTAVGYGLPVTNYPTTGHTVVGRGLDELRFSLYAGILMGTRGYLHGGYTFGMSEELDGYSLQRHLVDLDLGYSLLSWLTLRGYGIYQTSTGGIQWYTSDPSQPCPHCEGGSSVGGGAAEANFAQAGVGVVSPISSRISVTANVSTTVWGENIEDNTLFSIGMSWLLRSPKSKEDEWGKDW